MERIDVCRISQSYTGIGSTTFDIGKEFLCICTSSENGSLLKLWRKEDWMNNVDGNPCEPELLLEGHVNYITSVQFYSPNGLQDTLLCSASSDKIFLWKFEYPLKCVQEILIFDPLEEASSIGFDHSGELIAIALGNQVQILESSTSNLFVGLEGHTSKITKCKFSPRNHNHLVTISEDRTFKIWDLSLNELFYQSALLSIAPILSFAFDPVLPRLCLGFGDGTIKIFQIENKFCREIETIDLRTLLEKLEKNARIQEIQKLTPKVISSLPSWSRSENAQNTTRPRIQDETPELEVTPFILGIDYITTPSTDEKQHTGVYASLEDRSLVLPPYWILAGTPNFLVQIQALSYVVEIVQDFMQPSPFNGRPIHLAKEVCFNTFFPKNSQQYHQDSSLVCGILSSFQSQLTTLQLTVNKQSGLEKSTRTDQVQNQNPENVLPLSVFPSVQPPDDSLLLLRKKSQKRSPTSTTGSSLVKGGKSLTNAKPLTKPNTKPLTKSTTNSNTKPKKNSLKDQPVTFHRKIKSSGYGASDPPIPLGGRIQKKKINVSNQVEIKKMKEYPVSCNLLNHYQMKNALPHHAIHSAGINQIKYSKDGQYLLTASSDTTARILRLPLSKYKGEGETFVGHTSSVKTVHWSDDQSMILTSSGDGTCRLWSCGAKKGNDVSLVMDMEKPNNGKMMMMMATTTTPDYSQVRTLNVNSRNQEIADSRFYYLDKFIVTSKGNKLHFLTYDIDRTEKSDIERYEPRATYEKARTWQCDAQAITCFSCFNSFLSHLVICGASNKAITILDVAVDKVVRVIPNAHSRPIHTICLPAPSIYTSHPSSCYDTFLSSSIDSVINMWDLRSDQRIMKFGEHVNRVQQIGMTFSPCMRYMATGSEDKVVYLYDLRTGRYLERLNGHSDVVSSVDFHPFYPQLVSSSFDATLRFYTDGSSSSPQ